jgi:hypothetical protein
VVQHLAVYTIGENQSGSSEPTPAIGRSVLGALTFRHPSCAAPHLLRVGAKSTRQQRSSTWHGEAAMKVSHHFEKSVWPLFLDEITPTSQRHGATPCVGCKSVKEL